MYKVTVLFRAVAGDICGKTNEQVSIVSIQNKTQNISQNVEDSGKDLQGKKWVIISFFQDTLTYIRII